MVIRISEGEASFNSEIQNDPIDPENCTFQEEWFDFWDDEGKAQPDFSDPKFLFVGANDPSLGKNKKSDTSSIIALAKDTQTGYLYVVIADIAKRKPDQIIEDALDASRRLQREYKRPYYKFGVETVQFQYYFAEIMRQRAAAVGEYLPTGRAAAGNRSNSNRIAPTLGRHSIPQAAQIFKLQTANVGGRGELPSRSLGGDKGAFSHARECPPLLRGHRGRTSASPLALCTLFML